MITKSHKLTHAPRPKNEWYDIVSFLMGEECVGVRKKLCISCGFGKLYDKQGKEIKVSRYFTLSQVKGIVEMIKAQN